jgi:hypothetical protein
VPIIRILKHMDAEVIIGADNGPYDFLKKEFPELKFIRFPFFKISYPNKGQDLRGFKNLLGLFYGSMVMKMILSIPKILNGIRKEHSLLNRIIGENDIDIVISDNRYGLWNKRVYSIFITHQIMVKSPCTVHRALCSVIIEGLIHRIIKWFVRHYDECWIPDFAGADNLSGELSHKYRLPENSFFIEPLSRFNFSQRRKDANDAGSIKSGQLQDGKVNLLIILSGPEPQRKIFETLVRNQLSVVSKEFNKLVIVRGKIDEDKGVIENGNLSIYSHAVTKILEELIKSSDEIICRPGYSSIMDLVKSGKKAIFVPTPGQTEQEYLAEYLFKKGLYYYEKQKDFDLIRAIKSSENYKGLKLNYENRVLYERIEKIISEVWD